MNNATEKDFLMKRGHELRFKKGHVQKTRRRCQGCYKVNCVTVGYRVAKNRTKKVASYCPDCPKQPHYCLECFNREHGT